MKNICLFITLTLVQIVSNAQQKVTTTASKLKYEIINEGNGKKPLPTDKVTFNYRGTLEDGTVFDDSYKRG